MTNGLTKSYGRSAILIRLMVGGVFLSEGIQKFLFAAQLGAGRFEKLGIPVPHVLGPVVGATEIVCGIAALAGAWLRLTTLPLLAVILVAIATTKVPMLHTQGIWATLHDGRADYSMLMGLLFLLSAGAGRWSVDARRAVASEAVHNGDQR